MRLTLHTDYALRVLIYATLKRGELTTIQEIAEHFGISKNHLMKVVHQLGRRGYLATLRGKNGGFRIARAPGEINVGNVVRATEDANEMLACLRGPGLCRIDRHCVLQGAVQDARRAFLAVLDRYTLEDLVKPGSRLAGALAADLDIAAAAGG